MNENKLSQEQIDVAAKWWGEVLQNPKMDAGIESPMLMALMAINVKKLDQKKIDIFDSRLKELMSAESAIPWIRVDYHPEGVLLNAMNDAGISHTNAPIKTSMAFRNGGVQVKYGYTSGWEDLIPDAVA